MEQEQQALKSRNSRDTLTFDPEFKVGSGVSFFQVDRPPSGSQNGSPKSNWHGHTLAKPGEIGPDWWTEGRAEEDLRIQREELGMELQRISIPWERIEPEEGTIDKQAVLRFREIIEEIISLKMKPIATINHGSVPAWAGDWEDKKIIKRFKNFTEHVMYYYGGYFDHILTVNEPEVITGAGYIAGKWPPGKKNLWAAFNAGNNIIKAHDEAFNVIKKHDPTIQVGMTHQIIGMKPHNPDSFFDETVTSIAREINTTFASYTNEQTDLKGANIYLGLDLMLDLNAREISFHDSAFGIPETLPFMRSILPDGPKSDLGWPIAPGHFLDALIYLHEKYKKPIMITENGIADSSDEKRAYYYLVHLAAVHEAQRRGIDIPFYLTWASVDNLEFTEGYAPQFGNVYVNHVTGERRVRKSTKVLTKVAREKELYIPDALDLVPPELREGAEVILFQLQNAA